MKTKMILLIIAVIGLFNSCEKDNSTDNLNVGLIAYYPFNGNANDESGKEHNGIVYGASLTNDRFGNPNKTYSFNGVDNYISLPNMVDTLPRTINLWFNVADISYGLSYGSIFQLDNPNLSYGNTGIAVKDINSTKKLLLTISAITDTIDLITNTWYNVTIVANSNKSVKYYLNSDKIGEKVFTNYLTSTNGLNRIIIGANRLAVNYYFKGLIDDIRIYNRALTESEISEIKNLDK